MQLARRVDLPVEPGRRVEPCVPVENVEPGRRVDAVAPSHVVVAEAPAAGLALGLADRGGGEAEEHRHLREHALGELAEVRVPGQAGRRARSEDGVVVADLGRLQRGHRGEGVRSHRQASHQLGGRAECPEPDGGLGSPVLADHALADVQGDVGVPGHLRGRRHQRDRLVVGDPGGGVLELVGLAALAAGGQDSGHTGVAGRRADVTDDDPGHRPRHLAGPAALMPRPADGHGAPFWRLARVRVAPTPCPRPRGADDAVHGSYPRPWPERPDHLTVAGGRRPVAGTRGAAR